MAKGNVLLGKVRGKIGDIVFYVNDDKQCQKARNRHPKNPRTLQQQSQRSVMASVLAMYSAGKSIFDHSFEGKNSPKANYCRFMKVNVDKLRADFIADFQQDRHYNSEARLVGPGAVCPSPYTFIVSEGSLTQDLFDVWDNDGQLLVGVKDTLIEASVADYLNIDDIYTILVLGNEDGQRYNDIYAPASTFGFARLIVKNIPDRLFSDYNFDDIFEIDTYNLTFNGNWALESGLSIIDMNPSSIDKGAMAVIKSRDDRKLRSTSYFVCSKEMPWGYYWKTALEAWSFVDKGPGHSNRILEGGNI